MIGGMEMVRLTKDYRPSPYGGQWRCKICRVATRKEREARKKGDIR